MIGKNETKREKVMCATGSSINAHASFDKRGIIRLRKGAVFLSHLDFFEMERKEKEQRENSIC
jgi:hypothetical protein